MSLTMHTLLVANRGEIAARIIDFHTGTLAHWLAERSQGDPA